MAKQVCHHLFLWEGREISRVGFYSSGAFSARVRRTRVLTSHAVVYISRFFGYVELLANQEYEGVFIDYAFYFYW